MATLKICDGCGTSSASLYDVQVTATLYEGDQPNHSDYDLCGECCARFAPTLLARKKRQRKAKDAK